MINPDLVQRVRESYARCCSQGTVFLDTFYALFVASSPEVRLAFANTEMSRQKSMLREGLAAVIAYASERPFAALGVERLAEVHSRPRANIPPPLYMVWTECLLAALRRHDPQFSPELERAWRAVVEPTLTRMKQGYALGR